MKTKYIQLLKSQVEKLDVSDFDLEAWKSSAISALERVFGKSDSRIAHIEGLKIDYSSWALRDSNSQYKPVESCKRKGKEIFNSAIEELEIFGMPTGKESILEVYFGPEDLKILLSESDKKKEVIKKLKKEELLLLTLRLIEGSP
ncbi:MAG: hypothetical protein RIC30_16215 [Marinoscillum sp.]|uniref:hypothetical protein n=1 Tax=Marinoscillum sp. TaxID=2024838 RepID=UPI0032FD4F6B